MKIKSAFVWERFHKAPIIGILRGITINQIEQVVSTYEAAELTTLEVTMNTVGACEIIRSIRTNYPMLNIGAGTVRTVDDLQKALDTGAQFIVTPILNETVIKEAVAMGIPIFPGAFTPTEIYKAWTLGASGVKLFPATQLGPQYVKDLLAPLNDLKIIPTGGVSAENIAAYFEAGAFGVGMGSSLIDKKLLQQEDYVALKNHFIRVKHEIKGFIKQG
ncbi:MAG: bifunctional 4-hydroxy-2-oxoglutarate aldolase/2-dehydro-3-deoxy-phosphogluconate aldolase [Flavobacteriaceae bacterium]